MKGVDYGYEYCRSAQLKYYRTSWVLFS